jgi:hypothetical protein
MKTLKALDAAYMLFIVFAIASCKKDTTGDLPNPNIEKVKAWMNARKSVEPKNAKKIEQLQAFLNYTTIREEQHNEVEKILIISINDAYKIEHNINKNATVNLLVALNLNGKVAYAQIVLFTPEKVQSPSQRSGNSSYNFGNPKQGVADGKYVFCTLTGTRLRELTYKEGSLREQGIIGPKVHNQNAMKLTIIRPNSVACTEWYLVTTYYDASGNVLYQTEQFLYSIGNCGGGISPDENQVPQPDDPSGGGGEIDRTAMRYIDTNPRIPGNDTTRVRGTVYFHGSYGFFDAATWYGSQAFWLDQTWHYIQTIGNATYTNSPTPRATAWFAGSVSSPDNGSSWDVGASLNYSYAQAFGL